MKPEELDELFRRGLAEQSLPPHPAAWETIQQRLRETANEADEELPAFLRGGVKAPAAPPTAAPMVASRGGAEMSISWYQRPVWRAAAVAMLALGGALAYERHAFDGDEAPTTPMLTVTKSLREMVPAAALQPTDAENIPVASLQPVATEPAAVAATAQPAPIAAVTATSEPVEVTSDSHYTAFRAAEGKKVTTESLARVGRPKKNIRARQPEGVFFTQTRKNAETANDRQTDEQPAAAQPEQLAMNEGAPANASEWEVTIRPQQAEAPATVLTAQGRDENRSLAIEEEADSKVARLVSRATGRPVPRAADVLRRAGDRFRNLLDRADRTQDGRLTIDTEVAGRPVRKTFSL